MSPRWGKSIGLTGSQCRGSRLGTLSPGTLWRWLVSDGIEWSRAGGLGFEAKKMYMLGARTGHFLILGPGGSQGGGVFASPSRLLRRSPQGTVAAAPPPCESLTGTASPVPEAAGRPLSPASHPVLASNRWSPVPANGPISTPSRGLAPLLPPPKLGQP